MANGKLYAFKLATSGAVWVLIGNGRGWMQTSTMAAQHQVGVNSPEVAVVDAQSPLWQLPVIGPTP